MKISISADFTIIDNTKKEYSSTIEINDCQTNFYEKELIDKICKVYNVKEEQITKLNLNPPVYI